MKSLCVLPFLLLSTAYAHHSLHEIISVGALLEVSTCIFDGPIPTCDVERPALENLNIELTNCERDGDYEICYGHQEIFRERGGYTFNATVDVKKVSFGQGEPQYEINASVWNSLSSRMASVVTIIPNSGSALTDTWRIEGDWLWGNAIYFKPILHLGPALPLAE